MPGKWINVENLAKELAVSRTPVWQALKDLEKEGLVTHEHGKGIRMVQMTLQMAWDLYTVRGVLEGLAAKIIGQIVDILLQMKNKVTIMKKSSPC